MVQPPIGATTVQLAAYRDGPTCLAYRVDTGLLTGLSRAVRAVLPIVAGTDRAHAVAEKYPGIKRFQVRLDAEDDRYADAYARQDVINLSSLQRDKATTMV
jgi:hypothetical protein